MGGTFSDPAGWLLLSPLLFTILLLDTLQDLRKKFLIPLICLVQRFEILPPLLIFFPLFLLLLQHLLNLQHDSSDPPLPHINRFFSLRLHVFRYKHIPACFPLPFASAGCLSNDLVPVDEPCHFLQIASALLLPHSVEGVSHYGDQHVEENKWHDQDGQDEDGSIQSRVVIKGEVPEVQKIHVHQEARIGVSRKSILRRGRGEEESDSDGGGQDEEHEWNHVPQYFNDNAEKDASALEEGEDVERLHALEQTQKGQKNHFWARIRGRGATAP